MSRITHRIAEIVVALGPKVTTVSHRPTYLPESVVRDFKVKEILSIENVDKIVLL